MNALAMRRRRRGALARTIAPGAVAFLALALFASVAVAIERPVALAPLAVAAACGLVLHLRVRREPEGSESRAVAAAGGWAIPLLPGIATIYFSFSDGGFFPGSVAFAAMLLALGLAMRVVLAEEPLAGFTPRAVVAAASLGMLALWTLLSAAWSDAPWRALTEFDRTLLYLLTLVLCASQVRSTTRMRRMVFCLAASIVLVCSVGLATRLFPDVLETVVSLQPGRLGYPLTYWNALGLVATIGIVLCTYLTTTERESRVARSLAAAAVPVLAATLYFTFSRGAIGACAIGLVVYVILARPRALLTGVVATAPTAALAVMAAYDADLLASDQPTSAAAIAQGHDVAVPILLCALGAGVLRAVLSPLDDRLARLRLPTRARRPVTAAAWATAVLVLAAGFFALDGPDLVSKNYKRFTSGQEVPDSGDLRTRLTNPGNNKRIEQWELALDAFDDAQFRGHGAGTYENLWYERRESAFALRDAHSLYVEELAEKGLVGFVLVVTVLVTLLVALAARARGRHRYLYAAIFAAAVLWLVRAGVDWDWEMPAVTLWLFAAGGIAMARHSEDAGRRRGLKRGFLSAALGLVGIALAIPPAVVVVSQSHWNEAEAAFAANDCERATHAADRSLAAIRFRPEPRVVLAYCSARRGDFAAGAAQMRKAIADDPRNWQYRYDAAVMLAGSGGDPRPAARAAARLNPLDSVARGAPARFGITSKPRLRALAASLVKPP